MFGQVVDGKQYVKEMENQKVDANHRPYADVRITNTGELVLMKRGMFFHRCAFQVYTMHPPHLCLCVTKCRT